MPSYITPKKNTAFIFYVGLVSQASRPQFQANPSLSAGDVLVSGDGGATANITTLPTVTPAAGRMVKVSLSAAEMNFDNVTVVFVDVAGAEWDSLIVNIATTARQIDDLLPTASYTAPLDSAGTATATQTGLTAQGYTATRAGYLDTLNGLVQAIWDKATSALTTVGSIGKWVLDKLDVAVSTRNSVAPDNTSIATILTRTDVATSTRNATTPPTAAAVSTQVGTDLQTAHGVGSWQQGNTVTPPTVGAIADQVWDEANADHAIAGSTGANLSASGAVSDPDAMADAVWNWLTSNGYDAGSIAESILQKIALIGTSQGAVTLSPMSGGTSFNFTITRGDAYLIGGPPGRTAIEWTNTTGAWLDYVGLPAVFTATNRGVSISKSVVFALVSGDTVTATMELQSADTKLLTNSQLGYWLFDVQVTLASGVDDTPISGTMTVVKDYTPASVV